MVWPLPVLVRLMPLATVMFWFAAAAVKMARLPFVHAPVQLLVVVSQLPSVTPVHVWVAAKRLTEAEAKTPTESRRSR